MISKKLFFVLVLVVLVLLGLSVWLGSLVFKTARPNPAGPSDYSAVYLMTGDIYYGKIHWFPRLHLTNVWVLQRPSEQNGQLGITRFAQAFWQPVDEVYLNSDQVVFWTRLRNDSQLLNYFNTSAAAAGSPSANVPNPQSPAGGLPPVSPAP